ncbi:MAG TPA: hypothetical protein VK806_09500 [Bacteroidia bacterium]|jgi:hypothetical protein|nr:hypothetical protein [Bacteroidia bacterium]
MNIIAFISSPATNLVKDFDATTQFPYIYKIGYIKVWQINTSSCGTYETFNCSSCFPGSYVSKLYKSVVIGGSGDVNDSILNRGAFSIYGQDSVIMRDGFSIDANSNVVIDNMACSNWTNSPNPSPSVQPVPDAWLEGYH